MRATAPARAKQAIIGSAPAQAPKPQKTTEKDSSDDDDDDSDVDDAEAGTLNKKAKEVSGYDDDSSDSDEAPAAPPPVQDEEEQPKKRAARGERKLAVGVMGRRDDDRLVFDITVDCAGGAQRVPLGTYIEDALSKVTVRSCQGVSRATFVPNRGLIVEGNDFHSVHAFCGDHGDTVDLNALTANDISAILHTYGVEAARATIIQEVTGVFGVYGIDIEPHHLSLIADFMTAGGGYRAMNRGAMMDHSSPYLQMSFETTASFLTSAAQSSAVDTLQSPSASIVVGQPVKVGTNSFDVMVPLG